MERDELEFALKISDLRQRGWYYDILNNLILINESDDIRELCDLHHKINEDLTELTIDRISGLMRRASARAERIFTDAAVQAQGGT